MVHATRTRRPSAFAILVAMLVVILVVAVVAAVLMLRPPDFPPMPIPTVSSV